MVWWAWHNRGYSTKTDLAQWLFDGSSTLCSINNTFFCFPKVTIFRWNYIYIYIWMDGWVDRIYLYKNQFRHCLKHHCIYIYIYCLYILLGKSITSSQVIWMLWHRHCNVVEIPCGTCCNSLSCPRLTRRKAMFWSIWGFNSWFLGVFTNNVYIYICINAHISYIYICV